MKVSQVLSIPLVLCLFVPLRGQQVVINEIHYDPPDKALLEEFIELYNSGPVPVDLSGWYFSGGIEFTFPENTILGAGDYVVVAENPGSFRRRFGDLPVLGPYSGFLSNDGESIVLRNAWGEKEDEVDYRVRFPWPIASGGKGVSMELIHPLLDNDLGGSWRAADTPRYLPPERVYFLRREDPQWHYRKGTSEASDPISAWRQPDFQEDGSWLVGQTSVGFGDNDDNTVLDDMQDNYTSVYLRRVVELPDPREIPRLMLSLYVDDGCILWINGMEVWRERVSSGEKLFDDVAANNEARWKDFSLKNYNAYLVPGINTIALHALNTSPNSNDFSIDMELFIPSRGELTIQPTPGELNSVYSETAPPHIRQVEHFPLQPLSGEDIVISAKVTDPDGVASVTMKYQIVLPGHYVPAELAWEPNVLMSSPTRPREPNPAFEDPANWTEVALADDGNGADEEAGDAIYTGIIPPQGNRTLVRYRITVEDTLSESITVPYGDDPSLNFACFVYDGIPPYRTTRMSVHPEGAGHVYPPAVLESLPVYFLITREEELVRCIAYNGGWRIPKSNEAARDAFNWEGAFVYNRIAYDHVHYRLRQANDRYGAQGKRSWRIRFNKGHYLEAHDNYGREYRTPRRTLNIGKMFDNKDVGNFGLTETLNHILWNMVGVPAPDCHTFHFRIIRREDEAPAGVTGQYYGDFWGMALVMENYDPRFLAAHNLPDGNLYKLKDGIFNGLLLKRNQGRYAIRGDQDFQNIHNNLRPDKDANWLNLNVNYDRWYSYHAVVEGIRHYDFRPADTHMKNRAWFFEPHPENIYGRLWTLPWDSDASWGPNWNSGEDYSKQAIFGGGGKPEFKQKYRNTIREFRDLLWTEEVIPRMIDDLAAFVTEFSMADRDRWRGAPADVGNQDFGSLEAKVQDMKNFAFVGWTGSTGPTVPAGGRARYLDQLASAESDAQRIPDTPTIRATGPDHFPIDQLIFETGPFSDPQGDETFGAMKWRVGEVMDPGRPFNPYQPRIYEWNAVWESEELDSFVDQMAIPLGKILPGRTYRVRVRMMDDTARWSHWSDPVEFRAGEPDEPIPSLQYLRVTEILYNPLDGGDLEFIELQNTGPDILDLGEVKFTDGIEFSFAESEVTSLEAGGYVVLVANLKAFDLLYDTTVINIGGEYRGRLDNGGEQITFSFGEGLEIQKFAFNDDWYDSTDGQGHSLVIKDPGGPLEMWSRKDGWSPSTVLHGTPGGPDDGIAPLGGPQIPGDLNQDGSLDLADSIGLLSHLYLGTPTRLPCKGGSILDEGNLALLDSNGDGEVNLSDIIYNLEYMFLAGSEPVLGMNCTRITGCPAACFD